MSHEFRAPISSTLMLLESLLEREIAQASRNIVLIVIHQMNLLLCLVNDMLDMKKIE